MGLRSATDLFSEWADSGRDVGMEQGHAASVEVMLEKLLSKREGPFTAIDIGCGNGWVVRRLSAPPLCRGATGVDGAPSMIAKARTVDPNGSYVEAMLPDWKPPEPVDLIHSMECLYYLEEPLRFLQTLHDEWMRRHNEWRPVVRGHTSLYKLRKGLDVLVATPGRLMDLYQQNAVRFNEVEILVLDEADRMLDMGFVHDVKKVIAKLPAKRQNLLFSATFPSTMHTVAAAMQRRPLTLRVGAAQPALAVPLPALLLLPRRAGTRRRRVEGRRVGLRRRELFRRVRRRAGRAAKV